MAWLGFQEVSDLGAHRERRKHPVGESRALILSLATPSGSLEEFTEVNRNSWRSFFFFFFNLKLFGYTGSLLQAFSSCRAQRYSSCSVQVSLIVVTSLVAEHRL